MLVELLIGMGIGNAYSKKIKPKPKFRIKDDSVRKALEQMRETQAREILRQTANEDALKAVLKEEGYL
jgi:hypothetical protein